VSRSEDRGIQASGKDATIALTGSVCTTGKVVCTIGKIAPSDVDSSLSQLSVGKLVLSQTFTNGLPRPG
jgi:hypothetical protein